VAGVADHGARYHGTWAGAFEHERLVAVAQHTQVFETIIVQAPVQVAAVVRTAARASGRPVSGFIGPRVQVGAARTALGFDHAPLRMASDEGLYAVSLDALAVPALLADGRGRCRRSREADIAVLAGWREEYRIATNNDRPGPALTAASRDDVELGVVEGSGFVLDVEGVPVAYQQFNAVVDDVVQVGGVWTPPALRGRGYGRAVVAGSLLAARAQGARRSVLFTGEDNVAAQRAYAALGFTRTGDWALVFLAKSLRPAWE
jgi:ribosomal protein S18 acetylase RimI-like enzyme